MSTSTPNMGLTKPDPDASVGTWDTELNASLDVADAHDHTTGNGVRVPVAGINVNADLSFAGFGATALKVADLAAVLASTVTGYPTALFCNSADNELYWRTSGGVNVQLTSGTSLNAALLGGFTGDYGTGGSAANFNSGTSIYNFLRAANNRAFIDSSDIRLFQGGVGVATSVKIRSPNALAASYDWIFPATLPAQADALSISPTGQVTTGLKRGSKVRQVSPLSGQADGAHGTFTINGTWVSTTGAAADDFMIPLQVDEGERILAVSLRVVPATGAVTFSLNRQNTNGTTTALGTVVSSGTARQTLVIAALTEVVDSDVESYFLLVDLPGSNNIIVESAQVTTDIP